MSALLNDLRALGIVPGDRVALHSSWRAVRPVEGGAEAVIDALQQAIVPHGTLMMPAFREHLGEPFQLETTPSGCGLLTELFRRRPGVQRSLHVSHSALAWGDRADWIVSAHEEGRTALGVDSPFDRLAQIGGKTLMAGVGFNRNSLIHVGEAHARVPYLDVPWLPEFAAPVDYFDRAGVRRSTRIAECPGCSENFGVVEARMRRKGLVRDGKLGNAAAMVALGRDVIATVKEMLAESPDALLCPEASGCPHCAPARAAIRSWSQR